MTPERTGGRYCCYRWHGDNPVTFERYLKHTMEHGHANDRGGQLLLVRLLVSDHAVHGFSGAAAGGAADSDGQGGIASGFGFVGFVKKA